MPDDEENEITIGADLDGNGENDFSITLSGEGELWNIRLTWFAIGGSVMTLVYLGIVTLS